MDESLESRTKSLTEKYPINVNYGEYYHKLFQRMFELGFKLSGEPLTKNVPVFEYRREGRIIYMVPMSDDFDKEPPGYLRVILNPVSKISGISKRHKEALDKTMAGIFVAYSYFVGVEMEPNNNRYRDNREWEGSNWNEILESGDNDPLPLPLLIYKIEFLKTLFDTAGAASLFVHQGMLEGLNGFENRRNSHKKYVLTK